MNRSTNHRGNKRQRIQYESESELQLEEQNTTRKKTQTKTKKQLISDLLDLLQIEKDNSFQKVPNDGFSQDSLCRDKRCFQRANLLVSKIISSVCDLVCPASISFKTNFLNYEKGSEEKNDKLLSNMAKLVFFGNRTTRLDVF